MGIHVDSLKSLFVAQLKDAYSAETQLLDALPSMIKAAKSSELQNALQGHLNETEVHRERIEGIFSELEFKPGGEKCAAMAGLIEEANGLVNDHVTDDAAVDAAIICACQKVEHYEIATYGTLHQYAESLGMTEAASTIQSTLDEEYDADKKLTKIAKATANVSAKNA